VHLLKKRKNMDSKETKLHEQDAPLKNTDDAFVQVGEDGLPIIPKQEDEKEKVSKEDTTDLDKR
jgi:hypothetical protein